MNDDNVVPFKAAEEMIWVCARCSCISWKLLNTGEVECCGCGHRSEGGNWAEELEVAAPQSPNDTQRVITHYETADFARAALLKSGKADDTVAVIVLKRDGHIGTWASLDHDEPEARKDWVRRHTAIGAAMICGEPADPHGGALPKEPETR